MRTATQRLLSLLSHPPTKTGLDNPAVAYEAALHVQPFDALQALAHKAIDCEKDRKIHSCAESRKRRV